MRNLFLYVQVLIVDSLLGGIRNEYMGAAEFEWGSQPVAWRALGRSAADGTLRTGLTTVRGIDLGPSYTRRYEPGSRYGDLTLHWAAVPTYRDSLTGAEVSVDMPELLAGAAHGRIRGKESLYVPELVKGSRHGWLSVDGQVNVHADADPRVARPCFVAMTSASGLRLAMQKAENFRDWKFVKE